MKTMQINVKNMRLTGFVAAIVVAGTHPVIANANHVCEGMEEIVNVHAQDSSPFDEINTGEIDERKPEGVFYETTYNLPGTDTCRVLEMSEDALSAIRHDPDYRDVYSASGYSCLWSTENSDLSRSERRRNFRKIVNHMKQCKTDGKRWRLRKTGAAGYDSAIAYGTEVRGKNGDIIVSLTAVNAYEVILFQATVLEE